MTKQQAPQQAGAAAAPDTSTATAAPPGRVVQLPWGRARVQEEVTVEGSTSDERHIEVGLMRLRNESDGEELLRFFYRTKGPIQRGPLTLRTSEIDELQGALADAPELRALLLRLAGVRE